VTADLEAGRAEQGIDDIEDLEGRSVAVVAGSTFASYIESEGVTTVGFDSKAEVFDAAADGEVDVVLANPFALATIGPEHGVTAVAGVLYAEFETFGLQQDSPWREPINAALAQLQARGRIQRIIDRWVN
jgi:polar amino acid transport system substrate-binding protein